MRENSQLTFSSLYKNLTKSNNTSLKDISGDIKLLFKMTACLLCGKEAAGFASFVNLISDGSFIDAGSRIISVIKQQKELTYIDHVLRMREAYAAICLSAFFDTLNIKLPKKLYNQIISFDSEKKQIFEKSLDSDVELKSLEKELVIPDLVYNCDKVYVFLEELYNEMGKNLIEFVNRLAFAEEGSEKELRLFQTVMKQLPKDAVESFKDQYLMLCAGCPEFYCYIQFGKEREFFADYEEKYRKLLSLATRTEKRLVNSLEDLRGALSAACTEYKKKEVQNVVETLLRNNQKIIKQPVAEGEEELLFPVIEDAFIPQRFRLLSYTGKEQLAQVNTWEPLKIEEDMHI